MGDEDTYSEEEVERRARETARRMMATPPQPKKQPDAPTPTEAEEVR